LHPYLGRVWTAMLLVTFAVWAVNLTKLPRAAKD
jgi:hypothetical protein